MTQPLLLLSVVGARPQFVKMAAICRALDRAQARDVALRHLIVHTGQHYDFEMSQSLFTDLVLPAPDVNLGVGSAAHGRQTAAMLSGLEECMLDARPDIAMVFGDTNSTLAGALAAAKLGIPIAHVEAGMRSGRRDMPEEINRIVADHLSQLLFCSTPLAVSNLRREGITDGVEVTGDVMLEVLEAHLEMADARHPVLAGVGVEPQNYALATVHRAENTGDPDRLGRIARALERLATHLPVVFPVHPRTRAALGDGGQLAGVKMIDPVGYLDMLCLERHARVIVTDSGGVQKEALWLRVPCVTLRDETEWPETLVGGWNVLSDVDGDAVVAAATRSAPSSLPSEALETRAASDRIIEAICAQDKKS